MVNKVSLSCISWIDPKPLPKVGFWLLASALTSWPKRVMMGLVGTSNPRPGPKIGDMKAFIRAKQYRALVTCVIEFTPAVRASDVLIDPGYTPPFDKNKIDTSLRVIAPISDDGVFHAGELSPISAVHTGRLHPSSSLILKKEDKVIASALIKFRAGAHTDSIGIEKANSPVHVPWVWSEFALVCTGSSYRLVCNGSIFPSHAWYVDGKNVAEIIQCLVTISENDPILTTGRPASGPQSISATDKDVGTIGGQSQAIKASTQIDVALNLK